MIVGLQLFCPVVPGGSGLVATRPIEKARVFTHFRPDPVRILLLSDAASRHSWVDDFAASAPFACGIFPPGIPSGLIPACLASTFFSFTAGLLAPGSRNCHPSGPSPARCTPNLGAVQTSSAMDMLYLPSCELTRRSATETAAATTAAGPRPSGQPSPYPGSQLKHRPWPCWIWGLLHSPFLDPANGAAVPPHPQTGQLLARAVQGH